MNDLNDLGITLTTAGVGIGSMASKVRRSRGSGASVSYEFSSFTFTAANLFGRTGPSRAQLLAHYNTTINPWLTDTTLFNCTSGIQLWTVPATASYTITARGAQGSDPSGTTGGLGAIMQGTFDLTAGEKIQILVGQTAPVGNAGRLYKSSSGGGGTFVVRNGATTAANVLVIAGGGGGTGSDRPSGANAVITTSGVTGRGGGSGGANGAGGTSTSANGAGSGFLTNGSISAPGYGFSFLNGGAGGATDATYAVYGGGFGGGGSPTNGQLFRYGGGGGYSGGGASSSFGEINGTGDTTGHWGGGGGSYNSGASQSNSVGNTGVGSVVITKIS